MSESELRRSVREIGAAIIAFVGIGLACAVFLLFIWALGE